MTHRDLVFATLDSLFVLHGESRRVDASLVARRIGVTPTRAAIAFLHLESRGLLDGGTARLTMAGLAAAAALSAERATVERAA